MGKKKISKKTGLLPGSIVHVGENWVDKPKVELFQFNAQKCETREILPQDEIPLPVDGWVTWINLVGLQDVAMISKIGKAYQLHPLVMEDIANTNQRAKLDEYDNMLYLTFKSLENFERQKGLGTDQVSFVLGPNFLLTFQEKPQDPFNGVRRQIKDGLGPVRKRGSDYLLFTLLDASIDLSFEVLEEIDDVIEVLDQQLLEAPTPELLRDIHRLKRCNTELRKIFWPLRDALEQLGRENQFIQHETSLYLRDVSDHIIRIIETLESFRDFLGSMLEIYLSSINNNLNMVMRFLTLVTTIFMPPTLLAGIYGMNFQHMPEISWKYGYPLALATMGAMMIGMFFYYKKKKWV